MTKKNYSKTRHIKHDHYRGVEVTLRSATEWSGYEDIEGFEVLSSHECWTGREWFSIINKDFYYTWESALAAARNRVSDFS